MSLQMESRLLVPKRNKREMFQWLTNCNRKRVRFIVISYLIKTVLVVIYFKYFRSNYKPIEPRLDSNISLPANISSVRRSKYSNFMAAKFFDMIPMLKNHQPMKNGDFTSHNLSKIESEVYTKNGLDKDFITKYCEKYADTFNVSNGVEKEVNAKLCFHPSEKSKVERWQKLLRTYLFRNVLPKYPEAAFVDIGAHFGAYTVSAAALGHRVFAFEQDPSYVKYLSTSVAINGLENRVSIYQTTLLSNYRCVQMNSRQMDQKIDEKIVKDTNCSHEDARISNKLDDLIPVFHSSGIKSAVLKLEVHGSESEAIMGGLRFLQTIQVPFIQMEFVNLQRLYILREENYPLVDFILKMKSLGYVPVDLADGTKTRNAALDIDSLSVWPNVIGWLKNENQLVSS